MISLSRGLVTLGAKATTLLEVSHHSVQRSRHKHNCMEEKKFYSLLIDRAVCGELALHSSSVQILIDREVKGAVVHVAVSGVYTPAAGRLLWLKDEGSRKGDRERGSKIRKEPRRTPKVSEEENTGF